MNKKLLLTMTVGLVTCALLGGTENDPGVKYADEQLKEIVQAEEYMKSVFKNPKTAENACILGDVETLKKMEQAGFDGWNNPEFILLAAEYGRPECCRYLIGHGADVNAKEEDGGKTILHMAAETGNLELYKYLIEKGADVNAKDKDDRTVLHYAARNKSGELCKYLIEKGADGDGVTILQNAAFCGNMELCSYLIGCLGVDVNAKDSIGNPILHLAAYHRDTELCKYLIEKGADVNAKDKNGRTVLHIAAYHGNMELCKYLIEKGADVNAKNKYNRTILHGAVEVGYEDLCKYLIEKGADVKAKTDAGDTILHRAAKSGSVELCRYLIEKGTDVNAKDKNDQTVLHCAAKSGSVELCKYLIEKGADVNAKDNNGWTVLYWGAWRGSMELCKYLIGLGMDVSAEAKDGWTVLHWGARSGNTELCEYLIGKGADICARSNGGITVLHMAALSRNGSLCKYLIEKGAYVNAEDKNGESVLYWAANNDRFQFYNGEIGIECSTDVGLCELLVEHGAAAKGMMIPPKTDDEVKEYLKSQGAVCFEETLAAREIETEFKTMKEKFGLPYALYVKLRRYQFQLKQSYDSDMQKAAFAVADEIIRTAPGSQFADAAKYIKGAIRAHMLSDQSDKKSIREVKKYLEGFIKENPNGLYRGEALMLLGQISLECEWDAKETEKYYNQALACFQKAYEKQSAVSMYDPLPENLKRQVTPEQPLRIVCGQWSRMENRNEDPLKLYNTACAPGWYADYCKKICTLVLGADLLWREKYDEAEKMWGTIINSDPDIRQRQAESKPNLLMSLQALCNEVKMGGRKERRFPLFWEKVLKLAEQSYWHVEDYAQSDIDLQFKELVPLHREEYKVKRDLFLKRDEAEVTAFLKAKLQDKSIDPRERFQANILLERVENKQEIEHFWDRRKRTAQEIEKMREGRPRGSGLKLSGIIWEDDSACTPLEEIDSTTFLREKETKLIYFFLEKFWKTPDADEHMQTSRRTGAIQHSYYPKFRKIVNYSS